MRDLAVITGASSGIGAAFARAFAARGHDLVVIGRHRDRLEEAATELARRYQVTVDTHVADLADPSNVEMLASAIARKRVSVLVNAAGFGTFGPFVDSLPAVQRALVEVQLLTPLRLAATVLPSMISERNGAIINVASIGALVPAPDNAVYCASKAALVAFTRSLALELRGSSVAVQALCPGFTRTRFHDTPEYAGIAIRRVVPGFFWSSPEEVVSISLRELGRRTVVVPRWRDRLLVWALSTGVVPFPRARTLRTKALVA
jgi:short-subunit dehydrogenase